ncbi:MAG TPA: PLP-dependent aminotransferase family protein [Candidatus Elarobacter sp.]|nr:PLP-dependent aminotransferase family protein [Candidatus Elarobacter sp.]
MRRIAPSHLDLLAEVRIDPRSPLPKHRQLYEALRRAIAEGRLRADDELPSTRELARELAVSRNTAIAAYEMLVAEGYIISRGGAGTFVAKNAVQVLPPPRPSVEPRPLSAMADMFRVSRLPLPPGPSKPFRPSSPAIDAFPYGPWSQLAARVLRGDVHGWMSDGSPVGLRSLRRAIARHLHAFRSSPCDPDQIIVTSGASSALFLCSMVLLDPNDAVWVEDPGYQRARLAFRTRTERIIPVPLDEAGIDIQTGIALSPRPRLIYTTPTHQWPLGIVMPPVRKRALIEFAAERGAWIVEDDYDGDLRFERRTYAALCGLDDSERTIHVGTFTKSLTPGLRIGYLVVPPDLVDAFVAAQQVVSRYPNPITQAILAEFLESGAAARHMHEMQMLYNERHELLRARIASKCSGFLDAKPSTGGTFTVAELATGIDDVALSAAFAAEGFESVPLSTTYAGSSGKRGLLLGHAVAKPEDIRAGVDTLARIAATPVSMPR